MKDKKEKNNKTRFVYLIEKYAIIRYILAIIFGIFGGLWIIFVSEVFVHLYS